MGDGSSSSGGSGGGGSVFNQFFGDVFGLPRWQKIVFTIAALIGGVGLGGKAAETFTAPAPAVTTAERAPGAGAPRNGFVSERDVPMSPATSQPDDGSVRSLLVKNAPWMTRVGVGFVVAFIIGWVFRAFIKLMTMMTIVIVLLLGSLSYFRVIDVDFTKATEEYATATQWMSDQGSKLKDAILSHIPASMSSTIGMFLGFKRK